MKGLFILRSVRRARLEGRVTQAGAEFLTLVLRDARFAGIGAWIKFYNEDRPHQAMNNQMPMAVWRAGMEKIEFEKIEAAAQAVDMPLRLDNVIALPTYPQQNQQQAAA